MASESPGGQGNPETGKARATQLDAAAPQEKGVPLKPRGLAGLLGTSAAIEPKATNLVASVVEDLKLARIKIDASVQCRAVLNKGIVANYAERMAAGDKFPPGVVFRVSGEYLLVDGWHRYEAAKIVGGKSFAAEVREGTRQEAIRFAVQANATHGLPRNNKDKHRAVELALRAFPKVSNRVIADFCMVSHTFVNHIRPELETVSSSDKRTGHDGKQRKAPKPRPRTSRKPSSMTRAKGPEDKEHTAKPERTGDKADEGAHQKEYFHRGEAWVRIESFLLGAIKEWPEDMLPTLSDQLHQFAERHCFAPPAKASGEVHAAAKRKPDKSKPAKGISGRGFWDQLNWELRNRDLADIWDEKEQTVRQMRYRYRYGAAVKCEPKQYEQKLEAEQAKAKAFRQSPRNTRNTTSPAQK